MNAIAKIDRRAQRRADVTPVLVGYIRSRMPAARSSALIEHVESGVPANKSPMRDAYVHLITAAQDLTAWMLDHGHSPVERTTQEIDAGCRTYVALETFRVQESLREIVATMSQCRHLIARGY